MIHVKYFQTVSSINSSYLYGGAKIPPLNPTHHLSVFTEQLLQRQKSQEGEVAITFRFFTVDNARVYLCFFSWVS